MPRSQIEKTLVALAGEHLVAGQLFLRGYVASHTPKNFPGVDMFVSRPGSGKYVPVQVKTALKPTRSSNVGAYFLPKADDLGKHPERAFVFVAVWSSGNDFEVSYYILTAERVLDISRHGLQQYVAAHPNVRPDQPLMLSIGDLEPFKGQWENLSLGS